MAVIEWHSACAYQRRSKAMKSPDEITSLIARRDQGKAENARFVHSDNIVGVLGEFPALTKVSVKVI